jgi:hypothetical protein
MASCDEATQLRQQRDVGPVNPHAFGGGGGARPAAAAAAAADAAAAGEQLLLQISQAQPSREAILAELFAHFDVDGTGALDHEQFERCFALVSSDVSLGEDEWQEVCRELGVDAAVGLPRGPDMFDQFFAELDDGGLRSVHERPLELVDAATACRVCGDRPSGLGGAAAVYCSEQQRTRLLAQGCLCERLEKRHATHTLEAGPEHAHTGQRLMELFHNYGDVVRQLVKDLQEATKSR